MKIDIAINRVNERIEEVLAGDSMQIAELYEHSGLKEGKRLRARLFLAFAGEESNKAIDIACSVELLHAATLIHDDILDNSSFRRGRAALYLEHGIPESILYGDYLFSEAFKLVSALKDPPITYEMISAMSEVLKGEILEQNRKGDISLTRAEYFRSIEMKSGCLFGISAKLGALMREDKEFNADASYAFGLNVGMAYQMIDDYVDYFGEGNDKERFNDISEGLVTLPLIDLVKRCSQDEKKMIRSILGQKNPGSQNLNTVMELMNYHNIAASIMDEVDKYLEKTKKLFSKKTYGEMCSEFDILSWIKKWISNAREEYCNSRRRICRSQRSETAQKA